MILAGGFNPLENIRQIWSFPQVGMKIKNLWNHQLGYVSLFTSTYGHESSPSHKATNVRMHPLIEDLQTLGFFNV